MEGEGEGNRLGVVAVVGREEGYIWIVSVREGQGEKEGRGRDDERRPATQMAAPERKQKNPATLTTHAGIICTARCAWSAPGDLAIRERRVYREDVLLRLHIDGHGSANKEAEENDGYVGRKRPYI